MGHDCGGVYLLKQPPIQRTELDGFEDFVAGDVLLSGEVDHGAGDFEDAVVGEAEKFIRSKLISARTVAEGLIFWTRYRFNSAVSHYMIFHFT